MMNMGMLGVNEAALAARLKEEQEWESRPIFEICCQCGEPIRCSTERFMGDYYIETEDGCVHEDCWTAYGESKLQEAKGK